MYQETANDVFFSSFFCTHSEKIKMIVEIVSTLMNYFEKTN